VVSLLLVFFSVCHRGFVFINFWGALGFGGGGGWFELPPTPVRHCMTK